LKAGCKGIVSGGISEYGDRSANGIFRVVGRNQVVQAIAINIAIANVKKAVFFIEKT